MTSSCPSASSDAALAAQILLEVPCCRAVLIPVGCPDGVHPASLELSSVIQFASGTLRLLSLGGDQRILTLADTAEFEASNEGGFYYPLLPKTPFCASGGECLIMPDHTSNDSFGLLFDAGGVREVIAMLESVGCNCIAKQALDAAKKEQHGKHVTLAGTGLQAAGKVAVESINLASGLLAWGIRQATETAKTSSLMEPSSKPVVLSDSTKEVVSSARYASRQAVVLSGVVIGSAAKLAGQVAGHVTSAASGIVGDGGAGAGESQWASDARYLGMSSMGAGAEILTALDEAANLIVDVGCRSSADLLGAKFGSDAGATSREGFHVVGNLMEAKSLARKKALAMALGVKTAGEVAASVSQGLGQPASDVAIGDLPVRSGICLGPRPSLNS